MQTSAAHDCLQVPLSEEERKAKEAAPDKMAIGTEGGFQVGDLHLINKSESSCKEKTHSSADLCCPNCNLLRVPECCVVHVWHGVDNLEIW